MARPAATPVVHIDDGRVRATEWRFQPGAETGWHIHGHDYVVIPLDDGPLRLEEPGGGERGAELKQHVPYARRAGVEHNVINAGSNDLAFLEVEIIDNPVNESRLALLARFSAAWNARDVDGIMACMTDDCVFAASAGPDAEGRRYEGQAAVRSANETLFDAFPEAAWTEARHSVFGDRGLSEWRFVGRNKDGKEIVVDGCDLLTFDGDLIRVKNSFRKARA